MLPWCRDMGLIDISNACVQSFWSAILPALLTVTFVLVSAAPSIRIFLTRVRDGIKPPLQSYVVLGEDEITETSLDTREDATTDNIHSTPFMYQWRLALLAFIALLEVFAWTAFGIYHLVRDDGDSKIAIFSIVIGTTWLYNVLKPVLCPRPTAYIDMFILYTFHLIFGVIRIGASIYYLQTTSVAILEWIGMSLNLVAIIAGLGIISTMPLKIPSDDLQKEIYDKRSPEDYASIFEWATYSWVYPLIKRGNTMEMKYEDVWDLTPAMHSGPIFAKFSSIERPNLLLRLIAANRSDLILDILLTVVTVSLSYAAPYFLRRILDLIENPTPERRSEAYVLALLAFVCAALKGEADAQHLFFGRRASARVSAQLVNAIYDKALKRRDYSGVVKEKETEPTKDVPKSNDPKPGADIGKVVNLNAYLLYGGPFEIILACAMLYSLMGSAAFAGFAVIVVAWILHIYVTQLKIPLQKGLSTSRDRRMSILHELVNAVRFIKFFTWEDSWIMRVMDARDKEMDWLKRSRMNSIESATLWAAAPVLVSFFSFFAYVYQGNKLTPSIAFTASSDLRIQPLNVFPNFIMQIFEARVSLERVEAFLNEEEISDYASSPVALSPDPEIYDGALAIQGGRFKWNKVGDKKANPPQERSGELTTQPVVQTEPAGPPVDAGEIALRDGNYFELRGISVRFPEGELSLVTGPTGCGKTALLLALLGEMTIVEGKLVRPKHTSGTEHLDSGAISYAAQTPWLQRGTVRQNILFGYPYDEQRYENVIESCALLPDFESWEEGDHTEVGDRGSNLSGGQKARVGVARAVYAQTQYFFPFPHAYYLLQDIKTSRFLYDQLICGPLLAGRTVILVTHHVELVLPSVAYIVHMQDGRIATQGYVKDLQASGRLPPLQEDLPEEESPKPPRKRKQRAKKPVPDEVSGAVTLSTYKTYLQASYEWGRAYGNAQMDTSMLHRPSKNASFEPNYQQNLVFLPDAGVHPLFFVKVYAIVGFFMALFNIASTTTLYFSGLRASRSLFHRLLEKVMHATLPWHDATPRGRILNRFSKDMDAIDISLSNNVSTISNALVNFLVAVITVIIFFPEFIVPALAIAFCYHFVAIRYLGINRQLRRMESTSRSPIFSGFGELLDGIVTIRAFQSESRFMKEFHGKVDIANKMYYNSWMTSRWLLFNYDVLGAFAVLATTLFALSGYVGAGTAGLSITSAMTFTFSVYLVCRFWASLELELNAVERVAEYLNIPQDFPTVIESNRPPAYWPSTSTTPFLSVEDISVRYAPGLPRVLSKVSFTLDAPARIGVVGRTGSGKSTLIISLLRFVDPELGRIVIDGIDIAKIGVRDLRSRITYIPEVLPLDEHEDVDCYDALRRVQLLGDDSQPRSSASGPSQAGADTSPGPLLTLDTEVAPGGANFSLGQRQLVAMARALLKRTPIVVLDEATSSVDFETDEKIQATLREQFNNSLLITVAHRLNNIIDYDRLIVLQDGKVVEFDTPLKLFYKEGGVFRDICRSSESYEELEATVAKVRDDLQAAST
ncbi:P-loop containing nucleoside triphosphate hydrolase protein [Pisolithus orientalis]|uniref:P-loop containing nucleoside triphosphate hydrolase protein n=1 Tax=Pisolithus orientalis TaxID=936130 RepID=UPI002225948F|nr:P-loop containing nucleoside triphosphate hydrolase protein [Pisolithus orientalis]KAI5999875.1 P-loop containing nucleoside triphosphate hydrolase protein [Pisolithus orientalis]